MDVKLFSLFANDKDEGFGSDGPRARMLDAMGNIIAMIHVNEASTHFSNLSLLGTWAASARVAGMFVYIQD